MYVMYVIRFEALSINTEVRVGRKSSYFHIRRL
jgi:hypothetical protein